MSLLYNLNLVVEGYAFLLVRYFGPLDYPSDE